MPGPEDADTGLDYYICDALPWAMREVLRSSGARELTLLGWCIGGTLCAMHAALEGSEPGPQPGPSDYAHRSEGFAVPHMGRA